MLAGAYGELRLIWSWTGMMMLGLCEIKFWNDICTITKEMEEALKRERDSFRAMTGTKKALQMTMITPYGVKAGKGPIISNQVKLDDLFLR